MKSIPAILVLVAFTLSSCSDKTAKIGYVNNQQVYDSFVLTKELSKQYDGIMEKGQKQLDSLEHELNDLAGRLNDQKKVEETDVKRYQLMKEEYMMKKEELESNGQSLLEKYNQQIFSQMNEYINAFGKENHYRYVLGATGQGNVMYADSTENCTKAVIAYINNKYKGTKE